MGDYKESPQSGVLLSVPVLNLRSAGGAMIVSDAVALKFRRRLISSIML